MIIAKEVIIMNVIVAILGIGALILLIYYVWILMKGDEQK